MEKNDSASATRDELETIKLRVETLNAQLKQHQKDVSTGFFCVYHREPIKTA